MLKRRWQPPILIDQDLDARGLEAASHMLGIGPSIVITEHRVPAERRRYLADERRQPVDLAGIETDEVTTQQQHVRPDHPKRITGPPQQVPVRSEPRMEVRGERNRERRGLGRSPGDLEGVIDDSQSRTKPEQMRKAGRPPAGVQQQFEPVHQPPYGELTG